MPTDSLISSDWHFTIWAILFGLTAFAFWSERTSIGRTLSGAVVAIIMGTVLSNLNVIPRDAPVYDVVWTYFVPLAIPLLLFKADLRRIVEESKGVLVAFAFGVAGTVIGGYIGVLILPDGYVSELTRGIISAGHIGGSMNIAAVGSAVGVEKDLMSFIVTSVGATLIVYLILIGLLPSIGLIREWIPSKIMAESGTYESQSSEPVIGVTEDLQAGVRVDFVSLSTAVFLSFAICAAGRWVSSALGVPDYAILFITGLVLMVANVFPKQMKSLNGDREIGILLLYVFFVAVGAGGDVISMLDGQMMIWVYNLIVVSTHLIVILFAAKLLRLDLAEVLIASNACVVGAATAAGMAASKGWRDLVTPGVMVGVLGYAIANFIGVALAKL